MAEEKKGPDVTIPEEFKFYRQRDYLAVRLNEAYAEYEKAAALVNRMGKGGLAVPQAQAQKAIMTLQIEADSLKTQCLAIVAEATIDSRDVLYAIVSELRKINARYDGLSRSMGSGRPSADAQGALAPWKHPLDTVSDSFAVHEASGQWPAPLCPVCNEAMKVEKWTDDGKQVVPEMWICDPTDAGHFKEHTGPMGLEEKQVQRCRVCRCIETFPCSRSVANGPVETCHWFEKNLCSACKEEAEAVCEFFAPHGLGRAPLCENDEVISGRKKCKHYDDVDGSCAKARLDLKRLHPELHEQIQEALASRPKCGECGADMFVKQIEIEGGKALRVGCTACVFSHIVKDTNPHFSEYAPFAEVDEKKKVLYVRDRRFSDAEKEAIELGFSNAEKIAREKEADEKDGAGEKLVHGVLTVEHGKLDEKAATEEKVVQGAPPLDQTLPLDTKPLCPVCQQELTKVEGDDEGEYACLGCGKSYWPDKAGEAGKDGES